MVVPTMPGRPATGQQCADHLNRLAQPVDSLTSTWEVEPECVVLFGIPAHDGVPAQVGALHKARVALEKYAQDKNAKLKAS